MDNQVSEEIPIPRRVRQGDSPPPPSSPPPPPPQLFTAAIQVFKNAQLEEKGINVDGERLSDLGFAGDVALTTEGVTDMEHHLNTVNEES